VQQLRDLACGGSGALFSAISIAAQDQSFIFASDKDDLIPKWMKAIQDPPEIDQVKRGPITSPRAQTTLNPKPETLNLSTGQARPTQPVQHGSLWFLLSPLPRVPRPRGLLRVQVRSINRHTCTPTPTPTPTRTHRFMADFCRGITPINGKAYASINGLAHTLPSCFSERFPFFFNGRENLHPFMDARLLAAHPRARAAA
jgi:hypothetical protein